MKRFLVLFFIVLLAPMVPSLVAERKSFVESIPAWLNSESGAKVVQITSQPVTSNNVHMEQRFTSADGRRVLIERQAYGQSPELWICDLDTTRLYRIGKGQAMTTLPTSVSYKSRNLDDGTFPYLTPANLHRWQQWFEKMESTNAQLPRELANVRSQRRELDIATLWKWFDLRTAWPDVYSEHQKVAERILAANKAKTSSGVAREWALGEELVSQLVTLIDAGGEKPLPAYLASSLTVRVSKFRVTRLHLQSIASNRSARSI
jgi:hypothetical protein